MIFSCLPPPNKCEWVHLRDFVDQYNSTLNKEYYRSRCLDKENRNEKQPEVMLAAPGEISIVVERKSVVWQSGYLRDHENEHKFQEFLEDTIHSHGSLFKDAPYQLTINAESLSGKSKRDTKRLAKDIAEMVVLNQISAKSPNDIRGKEPVPWLFRHIPPEEQDESVPDTGIGVLVNEKWRCFDSPGSSPSIETIKSEYVKEFERLAKAAAEKFVNYSECLKFLVVQFYGPSSDFLMDEDVDEIIISAHLPKSIDQVWLAAEDWISEYDDRVVWKRVR